MASRKKDLKVVPLVVSGMAQPFVSAGLRAAVNLEPLLMMTGLDIGDIRDGKKMMSGQSWYDFTDGVAEAVGDPTLGFQIGSQAALGTLPNLRNLQIEETNLGNLLTAMVIEAESLASLADYELIVRGCVAELNSHRTFQPERLPSQADGYFAGFLYRLLRNCCGDSWEPSEFLARICDPSALPNDVRAKSRVKRGSNLGVQFQFPSQWLLQKGDGTQYQNPANEDVRNTGFLSQISMLLELYQSEPKLALPVFAKHISMNPSALKRAFAEHQTSFHRELDTCRHARSRRLLKDTDLSMSQIGARVGFPESSAFCRAFKRWEGTSPGNFRQSLTKSIAEPKA